MSDYKNFTETDFEKIKDSLKTYLQAQDELKDYNFEGSAMTVLLNVLAYNTQYNAYYGNMLASEKFLNRAQKRKSVVELANNYGYVPYSAKSAKAYLSFELTVSSGYNSTITIPKDTKFTSVVDGIEYTFYTTKRTTIKPQEGIYQITDLEVAEGRHFTHRFLVDGTTKFFTIPNTNVDIDRVQVFVKSSPSTNESTQYSYYENITDITSSSLVYFIQETDNGKYEIYFGDNVLGKNVSVGNQVIVDYYVCSGSSGNYISQFIFDDSIDNVVAITQIAATKSIGGAEQEPIESIKLSTKKSYRSQNRAVVVDDFIDKIRSIAPNIKDVIVWGGEDEIPKQYGKVFYSAIFDDFSTISSNQDTKIKRQLQQEYMVKGITPEFSQPIYSNLIIDVSLKVKNTTTQSTKEILSSVVSAITTEYTEMLNKFGVEIYESILESYINQSNSAITSSTTRFKMYRKFQDALTSDTTNNIMFPQDMVADSFVSDTFKYQGTNYKLVSNNSVVYLKNLSTESITSVGTASSNYVTIQNPKTLYNMMLESSPSFHITPMDSDIIVTKNNIIKLESSDIEITVQ